MKKTLIILRITKQKSLFSELKKIAPCSEKRKNIQNFGRSKKILEQLIKIVIILKYQNKAKNISIILTFYRKISEQMKKISNCSEIFKMFMGV